jgi:hypothetical protein
VKFLGEEVLEKRKTEILAFLARQSYLCDIPTKNMSTITNENGWVTFSRSAEPGKTESEIVTKRCRDLKSIMLLNNEQTLLVEFKTPGIIGTSTITVDCSARKKDEESCSDITSFLKKACGTSNRRWLANLNAFFKD